MFRNYQNLSKFFESLGYYGPFPLVPLQHRLTVFSMVQIVFHYISVTALIGVFILKLDGSRVQKWMPLSLTAVGGYAISIKLFAIHH